MPDLVDTAWLPFLLPALGYVALYSFLGHKETRFLFPVMPLFNLAAAVGMSRIHRTAFPPASKDKTASLISRLAFVCGILAMLGTLFGNGLYVMVSEGNYPGGEVLEQAIRRAETHTSSGTSGSASKLEARVYIDVAAAQTGVSLFGQRAARQRTPWIDWTFEKAGYEPENQVAGTANWSKYTHLLTENRELAAGHDEFMAAFVAKGKPRWYLSQTEVGDSMYLLERTGWANRTISHQTDNSKE